MHDVVTIWPASHSVLLLCSAGALVLPLMQPTSDVVKTSLWLQKANEPVKSLDGVKQHMESHFDLIGQEDIPYLIRRHARKYEWVMSCCTVWRRRRDKDG